MSEHLVEGVLFRRMNPPEPEHLTEYAVHDRRNDALLGFVGKDAPGHWLAYSPGGTLVAEVDLNTRQDALDAVLNLWRS